MENKKAQNLSVTTIILIILGIIVLVVLILGFTMGWGNIKDWIAPSNNVQQIVSQCEVACAAGNTYDYCFLKRELKAEDEKLEDVSCYSLVEKKPAYGINKCSAIHGACDFESLVDSDALQEKCDELGVNEFYYLDDVKVKKVDCTAL